MAMARRLRRGEWMTSDAGYRTRCHPFGGPAACRSFRGPKPAASRVHRCINCVMPVLPDEIVDLLRRQHGVLARTQALALGLSPSEVRRLRETGAWETVLPSVYGVVGHRRTWIRRLWAGHLHAGPESVVAHEAAGRVHAFGQVPGGLVTLIVPSARRHPPPGVVWRRSTDLVPEDLSTWQGLPVTSVTRTVVDLAAVIHIARLRQVVEECIVDRRCGSAAIGVALGRVRHRGRPGTAALERVLDDLGDTQRLPRSLLERHLDEIIRLADLPAPSHEHPLPGRGVVDGFVDRCWPDVRLIVEADGRRWHERRQQMMKDADRTLEAQAVGYETSRMMWERLVHDPEGSVALLQAIYAERAALLKSPRANG